MIKEFLISCYQEVTKFILEVVTKCWDWLSSINISVKGLVNQISQSCCRCCSHASTKPNAFVKFITDISLSQWLAIVFVIIGLVFLCCSIALKERKRIFLKSSVVCFLLMVGFCASTELCWIVIAVLLVIMLLKFDAITTWIEALGKEEK